MLSKKAIRIAAVSGCAAALGFASASSATAGDVGISAVPGDLCHVAALYGPGYYEFGVMSSANLGSATWLYGLAPGKGFRIEGYGNYPGQPNSYRGHGNGLPTGYINRSVLNCP